MNCWYLKQLAVEGAERQILKHETKGHGQIILSFAHILALFYISNSEEIGMGM